MSDHEFENYLTLIGRLLRLSSTQRQAIGEELRDHFESRLAELIGRGLSHDEAVRLALEEFGDAAGLAASFSSIVQTRRRRLIMRCTALSVAALAGAVLVAMAVWPENQAGRMVGNAVAQTKDAGQPKEAARKEKPGELAAKANPEVDAKLDQRLDLEFVEIPLTDVLSFLQDKLKLQIYIKKSKLRAAALDPSAVPVSINLRGVRGGMAMNLILDDSTDGQLSYYVDDGIVFVTTADDVKQKVVTKIYDCRKLMAANGFPMGMGHDEAGAGPPALAAGGFPGYAPGIALSGMIMQIVDPHSWANANAGGVGNISEYNGLLIVSNTPAAQVEVARLLEDLERFSANADKKEANGIIDRR